MIPLTRGDCINGARPCPWISCRHHMPNAAPLDTCSLDAADRGPLTSRECGELLGLSHGRIQQIEIIAFEKIAKRLDRSILDDLPVDRSIAADADMSDVIDAEFKAAVDRAYKRIVPERERGDWT